MSARGRKRIAIVGGGKRAITLGRMLLGERDRAELVAIAEPRPDRREDCSRAFDLGPDRYYRDHRDLLERCPDLDGVLVATSVPTHAEVACDCMEKGLAVYLEKPIAGTIEGARRIVEVAQHTGARIQVGFNLRYAPFFEKIHDLAVSGALGRVLSINWSEGITVRMWADDYCRSHSYNSRAVTGNLLLEKSCHDIDMMNWLLDSRCARVASFGSRAYFLPRPEVPPRCSPACPEHEDCLFYAPTPERRGRVLPEESNVCVFHCGSDLVDRQTAIFEYEDGTVADLHVLPLWTPGGRLVHICGTRASLTAVYGDNRISVRDLRTGVETVYHPTETEAGHGGGDERCLRAFLDFIDDPVARPRAGVREGFESVLMGCAADIAARERRVVELAPLR